MTDVCTMATLDHVWPGSEDKLKAKADAGDSRSAQIYAGVVQAIGEIATGQGKCTECHSRIVSVDDFGCCSVARVERVVLAIPFCRRCAAGGEERVSAMAKVALAGLMPSAGGGVN